MPASVDAPPRAARSPPAISAPLGPVRGRNSPQGELPLQHPSMPSPPPGRPEGVGRSALPGGGVMGGRTCASATSAGACSFPWNTPKSFALHSRSPNRKRCQSNGLGATEASRTSLEERRCRPTSTWLPSLQPSLRPVSPMREVRAAAKPTKTAYQKPPLKYQKTARPPSPVLHRIPDLRRFPEAGRTCLAERERRPACTNPLIRGPAEAGELRQGSAAGRRAEPPAHRIRKQESNLRPDYGRKGGQFPVEHTEVA